jgi:hypothetical protein
MTTIDELEVRYKNLVDRRNTVQRDKDKVDAELAARKRALVQLIEQARKEGFDPDNLQADIRRMSEVLAIKYDTIEADIKAAEDLLKPMLREIEKS